MPTRTPTAPFDLDHRVALVTGANHGIGAATARTLRERLFKEHLERDTSLLGERESLSLFREIALANRNRRRNRDPHEGLAYAIDADAYGSS